MEVVSPLARYLSKSSTTQDSNTQLDSTVDLSQVRSATMWHINLKCMQWFVRSNISECFYSAKNSCYAPITQHSAIYFEEIYPQPLESNDGSYDSQSIHFGLNIKEDKIMSSQTCYLDFHSQRQRRVVQTWHRLQSWIPTLKPLQPRVTNLSVHTSDSSTWSEMITLKPNQIPMKRYRFRHRLYLRYGLLRNLGTMVRI